ncbi:MAG: ABC transporter substrate-binding protein, partial [Desulfobacter sp.]
MTYTTHIKFVISVCILIALSFFCGCSKHVIPLPSFPKPVQKYVAPQETVPELISQARILSEQGAVQDALVIYNYAFNLTQKLETGQYIYFKKIILDEIERLLSKTDPVEIRKFSDIKNLSIPRDILDYWEGYRFAQHEDYANAAMVLNAFLEKYPDHPRSAQIKELLAGMGARSFDKKKLGVILPLSGRYKLYGQKAMKGIELSLTRLSEFGIKDLSIVVKDSMSDPQQAAMCVEQLGKENVFFILGPIFVSKQVADKAQALGIPMMALTQKTEFPKYGDYIFTNFITPEMQVQALG